MADHSYPTQLPWRQRALWEGGWVFGAYKVIVGSQSYWLFNNGFSLYKCRSLYEIWPNGLSFCHHVFLCPAENSRAGGQDWLAKETNKGNRGKGKCSVMGGRGSVNFNLTTFGRENVRECASFVMMLFVILLMFWLFFSLSFHLLIKPPLCL